jgi:hypothetical protein
MKRISIVLLGIIALTDAQAPKMISIYLLTKFTPRVL